MKLSMKAMIKKDMKTFYLSKQVLTMAIVLPVIFCVLYPAIFTFAIAMGDEQTFLDMLKELGMLDVSTREGAIKEIYSFILMFVLLIPAMLGNLLGSAIITNEKENKTLETILYSPMTTKEFFKAKLLSSLIPGIIISFISGILCVLTIGGISLIGLSKFILPSVFFVLSILLFGPSMLFLMLTITLKLSSKSETSVQAQQKSGAFVLPVLIVLFIIISVLSIFSDLISSIAICIISLLFALLAILLFKNIVVSMNPEKLIK